MLEVEPGLMALASAFSHLLVPHPCPHRPPALPVNTDWVASSHWGPSGLGTLYEGSSAVCGASLA